MNKDNYMRIVRAFLKLATTHPDNTDELVQARKEAQDAKDALASEQSANKLTDSEQAEVQQALDTLAATEPPSDEAIEAVRQD